MSYNTEKGLFMVATGYHGGKYTYQRFPLELMTADSIEMTPDQMQDLDSHVNGYGYLKRFVLPHSRSKIEMNTSILTYGQKKEIISIIKAGYSIKDGECSEKKRHLRVMYYDDWTDDYKEGVFYVPDITFSYKMELDEKPMYQPIRIAFIET